MLEDKLLIRKLTRGSGDALGRIYEKYLRYLLTVATALLDDVNAAEDVVHDFFVSLAQSTDKLRVDGNLKGYLATCVANRARDVIRTRQRNPVQLDTADSLCSKTNGPMLSAVCAEELQQLSSALAKLPYDQRETIILHLLSGMKFRQIARSQDLSVNTIQSRYRYGLKKLRTLLNNEVPK